MFEDREDDLLGVTAPDLDGAAYQLKVFGERYYSAVIDEPEMSGEERPAGTFLRHFLEGLSRHLTRRDGDSA